MNNKYDDIINKDYFISLNHTRMSMEKRAAQFAPFAALTGYDDMIMEEGRFTFERREITNDKKLIISDKLKYINENLLNKRNVTFIYFVKDDKKIGGKYINKCGIVRRIDLYNRQIILTHREKIPIDRIIDLYY